MTRQRVDAETQAALYAAAQALLRQKDAAKNEEELHTVGGALGSASRMSHGLA